MLNHEITQEIYGEWHANDVVYITAIQWDALSDNKLTLYTLVQPRRRNGKSISPWPDKSAPLFKAVLEFGGVRKFQLNDTGPGPISFVGFDIKNIAERGWEDIKYLVEDYEFDRLEFYARSATLVSIAPVGSDELNALQ